MFCSLVCGDAFALWVGLSVDVAEFLINCVLLYFWEVCLLAGFCCVCLQFCFTVIDVVLLFVCDCLVVIVVFL